MKNKQRSELAVCGYAAVMALAELHPHKIKRFYYTADRAGAFAFLCKELASRRIPYNQTADGRDLEKLSGSVHHQGVTAMIEPPSFLPVSPDDIREWADKRENVLIFDNIANAQNAGAVIRSAAFFGIRRIVLSVQNAASLITTSAYRNAQGGMESVVLYAVRSLPAMLHDMGGKLLRFCTDAGGKVPLREIAALCGKTAGKKSKSCALILGNEETGVSESVKRLCDYSLRIPGVCTANGTRVLDSLNVAQAAAVILYEMSAVNGR